MINLDHIRTLGRTGTTQMGDRLVRASPVRGGRELDRILAIPRVRVWTDEERDDIRGIVTKPTSSMRLWDVQADALLSALTGPGVVAPIGVGGGKTLVACLIPTVLDRPGTILAPPGLCRQGRRMCAEYAEHFHIRQDTKWLPYSVLSDKRYAKILDQDRPEVLICDEAHMLRGKDSARTRRWLRYLHENPDTWVAVMSGTLTTRSISDFAHLLLYAQKSYFCLPRDWPTLTEWSEALDAEPVRAPGALERFCAPGESPREGWFRRLKETPGTVVGGDVDVGSSLILSVRRPPKMTLTNAALTKVADTWCLPDGTPVDAAAQLASVLRQVRCGGYYREVWDPGVDKDDIRDYKDARGAWNQWVRDYIRRSRSVDSPGAVLDAIGDDIPPERTEWLEWQARLTPGQEWVQYSEELYDWIRSSLPAKTPVILWTDYIEVGQRLAAHLGVPYCGAGTEPPKKARTCVLSIQAHGTGRNLQAWSEAWVVGGTPNPTRWEQLLGRLHRPGQSADEVRYTLLFPEEAQCAFAGAEYQQQLLGNRQKLLYATWEES